ncbi:putative metal-dependent hydrolase [Desulfohalotomaculum tongense]|uniref:M48 family metallopeptidase n=1 Tax=Desulforadius tongensis TaxID=1216062 RepID=UPI001958229E|nr:SprT family zinc-dependent metalloprotease [Desulforadius tongensis]MBM7853900.1 putative metal-dependent hydrolase [Desulforadius tongensis]
MKLSTNYGTQIINFEVMYSKRKTMEIRVEPPGVVKVVVPQNTPEQVILERVKSKGAWIVQKLFLLRSVEYRPIKREFVNGESFMYLGRNYSLQLQLDKTVKKPEVKLYQGKFQVKTPTNDEAAIRKAMELWYRNKTKEKVEERIKYYQHFFNIKPTNVKVKDQKKRWASCTSRNELLFNWRCVMASSPVLDYIVVHEMCHMVYKNHSQDFWGLVASIIPDYKWRKDWLKKYGVKMDL